MGRIITLQGVLLYMIIKLTLPCEVVIQSNCGHKVTCCDMYFRSTALVKKLQRHLYLQVIVQPRIRVWNLYSATIDLQLHSISDLLLYFFLLYKEFKHSLWLHSLYVTLVYHVHVLNATYIHNINRSATSPSRNDGPLMRHVA